MRSNKVSFHFMKGQAGHNALLKLSEGNSDNGRSMLCYLWLYCSCLCSAYHLIFLAKNDTSTLTSFLLSVRECHTQHAYLLVRHTCLWMMVCAAIHQIFRVLSKSQNVRYESFLIIFLTRSMFFWVTALAGWLGWGLSSIDCWLLINSRNQFLTVALKGKTSPKTLSKKQYFFFTT